MVSTLRGQIYKSFYDITRVLLQSLQSDPAITNDGNIYLLRSFRTTRILSTL